MKSEKSRQDGGDKSINFHIVLVSARVHAHLANVACWVIVVLLRLLVVAVGHEGHLAHGGLHRLAAHDRLELGAEGGLRGGHIGHADAGLEAG